MEWPNWHRKNSFLQQVDRLLGAQPRLTQVARQNKIAELLFRDAFISIAELVDMFQVSSMTIHRDLSQLEQQGILRKVKGGATAEPSYLFESHFPYRVKARAEEKQAIAAAAMSYIEPGDVIMLDDSTTALALAKRLPELSHLTLITNLLPTINLLQSATHIHLICLGGDYLPRHHAFVGSLCEEMIGSLRANTLFLSTSAVNAGFLFHQEENVVRIKQAMIRSSVRRILLLDHTKLGKQALRQIAPLSAFDLVIIDHKTPPDKIKMLTDQSVPFKIAPDPHAEGTSIQAAPPDNGRLAGDTRFPTDGKNR